MASEYTGDVIPLAEYNGDVIPLGGMAAPVSEESALDQLKRGTITERIKAGTILYPSEEDFIRKTLQGAASGPLSGIVQAGASALGFDDVAGKIAKTAKEGNFVGSLLQPESWLTGKAAGEFISKGTGLLTKGLRASPIGAAYGLTSASTDEDNIAADRVGNAAIGAGISFLSPTLFAGIAEGAGWAIDAAKGRLAAIRAGKVLRHVADAERPQLEAALRAAGNDVTAAQAAESVGSTKFSALGARAAQQDSQFTSEITAKQAAERAGIMEKMAGGSSAESSALNRTLFIKRAELALGPQRTKILNDLAAPGKDLQKILPELSETERRYVSALRENMTPGGNIAGVSNIHPSTEAAQSSVRNKAGKPGWISNADRSVEWAGAANDFAGIAKQLRSDADALRTQVSALPSAFTTAPILQNLEATLSSRVTQMNPEKTAVLNAVAEKLRIAGDDPVAIAELRKVSVNQLIGDLLDKNKLSKTSAAAALDDVKKSIDVQLGPEFVNRYLKPYSKKLANRDALALIDEMRQLQKDNPSEFVNVVKGDRPELIEKFSSAKTLQEALGDKRFNQVKMISAQIQRDQNLKYLASNGATEVGDILVKDASRGFRLPDFLSWKTTLANKALELGENMLDAKTMALVYRSLRNGKDAAALMAEIPTADKSAVLRLIRSGAITPYINPMATGVEQ